MKKRLVLMLLLTALIFSLTPNALSAGSLAFVGVNDSVPMYLAQEHTPYYKGNLLYIPYTVFNVGPGGVAVSYNAEKGSLALFTRAKRLVYDLNEGTVTDEASKVGKVDFVYRNGMLFIPATKSMSHFGLNTVMLTSSSGCPVLRITDGSQQLDNNTFIRKAETLISIILEQQSSGESVGQEREEELEDDPVVVTGPATMYLTFAGEAVNAGTLEVLKTNGISAAFFLTREQIKNNPELIRRIYADGHMIGLTTEEHDSDYVLELSEANAELDRVLHMKSLMVLLPNGGQELEQYIVFRDWGMQESIEEMLESDETVHFLVCRANVEIIVGRVLQAGANLPQVMETTRIPGITLR